MVCIDTDHAAMGKKLGNNTAVHARILFEEDEGEFAEGEIYCRGKS